jgi:hypothetical protein
LEAYLNICKVKSLFCKVIVSRQIFKALSRLFQIFFPPKFSFVFWKREFWREKITLQRLLDPTAPQLARQKQSKKSNRK